MTNQEESTPASWQTIYNLGRVAWRSVILCLMIYLIPRELTAILKETTFTKDISIKYHCNSSLLQELE
ncbi:hypothetical protein BVRB_011950 [Beta vulgaris subsp. vulgaris]|uniref:Uncharacterized protein n=1 Tax=Beta vulgaris subsp. vulgaris TaxID=3555 RepID=A0A0J8B5Q0_BETVV|nr:hypothetical protein BVRB_011950 [Beta vulgaris subsp. vulgaris]